MTDGERLSDDVDLLSVTDTFSNTGCLRAPVTLPPPSLFSRHDVGTDSELIWILEILSATAKKNAPVSRRRDEKSPGACAGADIYGSARSVASGKERAGGFGGGSGGGIYAKRNAVGRMPGQIVKFQIFQQGRPGDAWSNSSGRQEEIFSLSVPVDCRRRQRRRWALAAVAGRSI